MNNQTPENEVEEEVSESPILAAARYYFMELARDSDSLRELSESATTRTKRDFYKKKLARNNKQAITLLERIAKLEETKSKNKNIDVA